MLSMHVDTNVPSFARSFQDVACKVSENKVRILFSFYNSLSCSPDPSTDSEIQNPNVPSFDISRNFDRN